MHAAGHTRTHTRHTQVRTQIIRLTAHTGTPPPPAPLPARSREQLFDFQSLMDSASSKKKTKQTKGKTLRPLSLPGRPASDALCSQHSQKQCLCSSVSSRSFTGVTNHLRPRPGGELSRVSGSPGSGLPEHQPGPEVRQVRRQGPALQRLETYEAGAGLAGDTRSALGTPRPHRGTICWPPARGPGEPRAGATGQWGGLARLPGEALTGQQLPGLAEEGLAGCLHV